jgi:lipoate-protein ligase A
MQMALDHALLELATTERLSVLRLYRWAADTVSFGANEAAMRSWDRGRLEADGVPAVRRPTGGRAVWHAADDLTYSVVGPIAALGELRLAYRAIHQRIALALEALHLEPRLAPAPSRLPGLRGGACFDVAVGGEILIGNRKVVGSAQVASRGAMLQHGAIARADRLGALNRYRKELPVRDGATVAPDLPEAELLAGAIAAAWEGCGARRAGDELTRRALSMSVQQLDHYQDPAWTWRR